MEISGKILREVEFRDRLRGYDTDEVDEFLEKVAVSIDEMRAELVALREKPAAKVEAPAPAPRPVEQAAPTIDDDSIRRTLVLAQRTADLAISEAREEATHLVEEARTQSESMVNQAQDTARRVKEEAEFEAHEKVDRLAEQRDRLERDIQSLAQLLGSERDRLTQSLQSALGFVTESLSMSDDMSRAVTNIASGNHEAEQAPPAPSVQRVIEAPPEPIAPAPQSMSSYVPDVESEIEEDAETAYAGEPFLPTRQINEAPAQPGTESNLDADEELWARWAQGVEVDMPNDIEARMEAPDARQFPFPRGGDHK